MSKEGLANIQIATRALACCLIPFGTFYLVWILLSVLRPEKSYSGIYPVELSFFELAATVVLFVLLALTIVLPVVVLKRKIQRVKDRKA